MIKRWLRNKNKMSTTQPPPQQPPSTIAQQASLNTIANTTVAGGAAIGSSNYYGTYVLNGTTGIGNITIPSSNLYSIGNTGFANTSKSLISLNSNGKEILTVDTDGKVTWAGEINVDEAAEAFSKSLSISVEMKAGINKRIKREIRNSIFEDLISIAKEKGSLSVDELTYILEGAKIMDKLKGGDE